MDRGRRIVHLDNGENHQTLYYDEKGNLENTFFSTPRYAVMQDRNGRMTSKWDFCSNGDTIIHTMPYQPSDGCTMRHLSRKEIETNRDEVLTNQFLSERRRNMLESVPSSVITIYVKRRKNNP